MAKQPWFNTKAWGETHDATAGVTKHLGTFGGKVLNLIKKPFKAGLNASTNLVEGSAKTMVNATGHVTAVGTGAAHGLIKSPLGKKLGIAALVVGGLATAGVAIGKMGGRKHEPAMPEMPPMVPAADVDTNVAMADAATDNKWQQSVAASRNTGVPAR
jgi:hypothetical protein